jgi:hypothetical protein
VVEDVESSEVKFISEDCDRLAKLVAGGANLGNGRGLWGFIWIVSVIGSISVT